jgi:hypothetical protein
VGCHGNTPGELRSYSQELAFGRSLLCELTVEQSKVIYEARFILLLRHRLLFCSPWGGVPIVFYTFLPSISRYGFRKPPYEKTDQNKRPKDTIYSYIVQTRVVHILWIKNPTDPGMAIVTYQTSLGYQVHILPVINLQHFLLKKKASFILMV